MRPFFALEIFILTITVHFINGQKDVVEIPSICTTSPVINLTGKGQSSSITLNLASLTNGLMTPTKQCSVQITAPSTHFIYVRLVDDQQEKELLFQQQKDNAQDERNFEGDERVQAGRRVHSKRNGITHGCPVNVFLPESDSESASTESSLTQTRWPIDACGKTVPSDGTVFFTNDLHITWMPPISAPTRASRDRNERLKNRKLVITAIGNGEFCQSEDQHNCIIVGWTPFLCVAQELMCDGIIHCPSGGLLGDENPQVCKQSLTAANWERLATDFLKKFTGKTKPGSLIPAIQKDSTKWSDNWKNSNDTNSTTPEDVTSTFSQYGPWGYLMLGMLICGTVLTFCGLWECCCKRTKPNHQHFENTPTNSTITGGIIPSAVLVIGSDTHGDVASPPNYEDLDQPPSYSALFPDQKVVEVTIEQQSGPNNLETSRGAEGS